MKMPFAALILCLVPFAALLADEKEAEEKKEERKNPVAVITFKAGELEGEIHVELWPEAAPKTVANFLSLAEGTKEFKDPKTGEMVKRPFYDGLSFHRVIKDFMIQGGCPLGNGMGSPGYQFEDEINAVGLGLDKLKALTGGQPHRSGTRGWPPAQPPRREAF